MLWKEVSSHSDPIICGKNGKTFLSAARTNTRLLNKKEMDWQAVSVDNEWIIAQNA